MPLSSTPGSSLEGLTAREHQTDGLWSQAIYSRCETYRYSLTRIWSAEGPKITFVMLNPSTADELRNDPTIERCERRSRAMGYGAMRIVNLFAYRATQPAVLKAASDPVGPQNNAVLQEAANWADMVLCAWGVHGAHMDQAENVGRELRQAGHDLYHLGLTKAGHPRHPLYISYTVEPMPWRV